MRKRVGMGIMLAVAVVVAVCCQYFRERDAVLFQLEDGKPYISIRTVQSENKVYLWQEEEGGGCFFLPSCVDRHKIRMGDTGESSVRIDGHFYEKGDIFTWQEGNRYTFQITEASYDSHIYEVSFMKSSNIPAVFIDTASGGLEYIHEEKGNRETGAICVMREDGTAEYQDELLRISGRGNGTWEYEKRPYTLKLKGDYPLCGMSKGDRWHLLALWREGSRMDNKIAMDMAEEMGLSYSAQGSWVDLYMNGEYRGNYLLTESLTVGEGRIDIYDLEKENKSLNPSIRNGAAEHYETENNKGYLLNNGENISGGYLIQKNHPAHYETEKNGFRLSRGDLFAINAPGYASREQVAYIQNYMEEIDALVQERDPAVWEKMDIVSFAKRFLVDEISLEMDTGCASMFFYKDRDDEKLYSGPPWDYDNAFGEYGYGDGFYLNYGESIVNNNDRQALAMNWYQKLYDTPELYQCIVEEYKRTLPFFERLLDSGIDAYAEQIRDSVAMDDMRWNGERNPGDGTSRYESFEANVKYTKFFLTNRLNCLCARWNVPYETFEAPTDGTTHLVTFSVYEGVVETTEVLDGKPLVYTPSYDGGVYQGWEYRRSGEKYSPYVPVYEDMELYNAKWE